MLGVGVVLGGAVSAVAAAAVVDPVAAACTLTMDVEATMANRTTPAAMKGRRCFGANERSKPCSFNSLSMRGVRLLALAIATLGLDQWSRVAKANSVSA